IRANPNDPLVTVLPPPPPEESDAALVVDQSCVAAILGYHDFTTEKVTRRNSMKINVEDFRSQMLALQENDIPVISLRDFWEWKQGLRNIPDRSVVITIDDGWKAVHTLALPVLKEFGYPFTLFLYKNYVNVGGRSLTWQEVQEIMEGDGEIGSHSVSHRSLANRKGRNDEEYAEFLRVEMEDSRTFLKDRLGIETPFFAYPYGIYNDQAIEVGKKAGYELMVTVNGQMVGWQAKPMEMGRFIVHGENPFNFNLAMRYLTRGRKLAEGRNLVNVSDEDTGKALVQVRPAEGDKVVERNPVIEADLSGLTEIEVEGVEMEISGLGRVEPDFDLETGKLSYQPTQRLRLPDYRVLVKLKVKGQKKSDFLRWGFAIDPMPFYLDSPRRAIEAQQKKHDSPPVAAAAVEPEA
ncbi:MAG: polysaccharide deacetylase family protein, partial [Verrucomicrobiota bacterium]